MKSELTQIREGEAKVRKGKNLSKEMVDFVAKTHSAYNQ